jgi:hypothetical protein
MFDGGAMLLLFIFAVLFSMLFNYGAPKFVNFAMSKPTVARYGGSYAGRTLLTATIVFVFLIAVSYAMSAAGERPKLPA